MQSGVSADRKDRKILAGKKLGTFGYSVKKRKKAVPPKTKKTAKP